VRKSRRNSLFKGDTHRIIVFHDYDKKRTNLFEGTAWLPHYTLNGWPDSTGAKAKHIIIDTKTINSIRNKSNDCLAFCIQKWSLKRYSLKAYLDDILLRHFFPT